jgi:hypothetical protein
MAMKVPLAYAAASNYRKHANTSRVSNILQSYSSADRQRVFQERERVTAQAASMGLGSFQPQGSAFRAAAHIKGIHAGRNHPMYQTNAMEAFQFLSPALKGRPSWDASGPAGGGGGDGGFYRAPKNGKKGMFTKSFSSGMFEDTTIGSLQVKKVRKAKEMEEKARKACEKEQQYERVIQEQEEKIRQRREARLRRKEIYLEQKKATIVIQNHVRRTQAKRRVQLMFKNKHDRAAIIIQMCVRRYLTNRHVQNRVQHKVDTLAAQTIQATWSKRQERANARKELHRRRDEREKARRRLLREIEAARRDAAARKIQNMVKCRQARKFAEMIKKKKMRQRRLKRRKNNKNASRTSSMTRKRGGVLSGKAGVV